MTSIQFFMLADHMRSLRDEAEEQGLAHLAGHDEAAYVVLLVKARGAMQWELR